MKLSKLYVPLIAFCFAIILTAASKESTVSIMRNIYSAISELIPKTYDDKKFSKYSKATEDQLKKLSIYASSMEDHINNIGDLYGYAASRLKEDAKEAYDLYKKRKFGSVKFILRHITEDCIACHSKVGDPKSTAGVNSFIDKIEKSAATPLELAHYLTAARQFKRARDIYESELKKNAPLQKVIESDAMLNYLLINIRIFKDFKRPLALLQSKKLPKHYTKQTKEILESWISQLKLAQKRNYFKTTNKLATAEKLIGKIDELTAVTEKNNLINYIIASTLLNQLSTQSSDPVVLNKAYYLLGLIVEQMESSLFVSETGYYLEKSITSAPGTEVSKKALIRLNEYINFSYSGSGGTHIPLRIKNKLTDLSKRNKEAKKTKKP